MSSISLGQAHEAEVTLSKAGATGENFWDPISKSESLCRKVLVFVAEMLRLVFTLKATTDRDMTDWKCEKPVLAEGEFELELKEFLRKGESYLDGKDMVKRAKELDIDSGLRHLEAILREQDKIPVEMRRFCLISTQVWLHSSGNRFVWYLSWCGKHWVLGYYSLSHILNSDYRLVASRKYQK